MLIAGAVAIALIFRGSKEQTVAPATIEAQPVASLPQQPVEVAPQAPAIPRASGWPSDLPPLPLIQFPPPRPREVVQAVYQFAVRHPEVLDYVPCFCGCEHSGHTANTDCFVRSREGGRIAWDDHGMT
ncbi:MAG: hypothetical protein HYZ58_12960 [Acidobacteria bacterium]|nr:hypothetical protein [Acidobacteriota bacterium]MBI3264043.1 hypothetical protein [Acidobacteriota bacterium]